MLLFKAYLVILVCFFVGVIYSFPVTPPSYPHYPSRQIQVLNGTWDFTFRYNFDLDNIDKFIQSMVFNETIEVPSAFDASGNWKMQRGTGFYRVNVTTTNNTALLLHFGACSMWCKVYVDNAFVGPNEGGSNAHTSGGFTPFWVTVPPSSNINREIIVVADNRFDVIRTVTQKVNYDFYQYGGIIRPVVLHEVPKSYIQRVETTIEDTISGAINISIIFSGVPLNSSMIGISWNDTKPIIFFNVRVINNVAHLNGLYVPFPKSWSPKTPNLHTITVSYVRPDRTIIDSILVRFGLRSIDIYNGQLYINSEPVKMLGFNRHEMYPDRGSSVTYEEMVQDIQLLKDLGANYIRGSHYPQDQRFLDLCDANGILVWEEQLAWGNSIDDLSNKWFMEMELLSLNSMISESYNHPSVILWGFFNEGPSNNPASTQYYQQMADAIRARDISRKVTWASNKVEKDVNLHICDVVSFNDYPGWYHGDVSSIKQTWDGHATWVKQNYKKPFIMSEWGAGAIYGWLNGTSVRYSEQYQTEVDTTSAQVCVKNNQITGCSLWQYADVQVEPGNPSRPGGLNNKGVFSRYRQPKLTEPGIKSIYNSYTSN